MHILPLLAQIQKNGDKIRPSLIEDVSDLTKRLSILAGQLDKMKDELSRAFTITRDKDYIDTAKTDMEDWLKSVIAATRVTTETGVDSYFVKRTREQLKSASIAILEC